jgi:hypothetical protein
MTESRIAKLVTFHVKLVKLLFQIVLLVTELKIEYLTEIAVFVIQAILTMEWMSNVKHAIGCVKPALNLEQKTLAKHVLQILMEEYMLQHRSMVHLLENVIARSINMMTEIPVKNAIIVVDTAVLVRLLRNVHNALLELIGNKMEPAGVPVDKDITMMDRM